MLDLDKNTVEAFNQVKTKVVYEFSNNSNYKTGLIIINLNENVKRETLAQFDYYPFYKELGNFFKGSTKELIFVDSFWPYVEIDPIVEKVSKELKGKFVHISDIS